MEDIQMWILQAVPGAASVDVMGEILKVGGVLSLVLAIAVVALWVKYNALVKHMMKEATASMAIVESFDNTLQRLVDEQGKGENRMTSVIKDGHNDMKGHIVELRGLITKTLKGDKNE